VEKWRSGEVGGSRGAFLPCIPGFPWLRKIIDEMKKASINRGF